MVSLFFINIERNEVKVDSVLNSFKKPFMMLKHKLAHLCPCNV